MSRNSAVSLEAHDNFRGPPAEMAREALAVLIPQQPPEPLEVRRRPVAVMSGFRYM